jgi:hypothetical protein
MKKSSSGTSKKKQVVVKVRHTPYAIRHTT